MTKTFWILALASFFFTPLTSHAFGVSPPSISALKLLKGSRYEAVVYLVRGDASKEIAVQAVFNVPDKIKSWVTLDKGDYFVIPAGVNQFPVKVLIQVPEEEELGIYSGSVSFNTLPVRKEADQVVISVGASVGLNLTVGEGAFVDFNVKNIEILDVKEGESPKIAVTLENTGNVPAAPERATFDLFDKHGQVRLGFAQNEKLPETPGFETKTFIVKFPIDLKLGLGEYWAEAKIYRDGAVVRELKTVFNVVERKINWPLYGGIGGGLIVVGFILFAIGRLRRRRI